LDFGRPPKSFAVWSEVGGIRAAPGSPVTANELPGASSFALHVADVNGRILTTVGNTRAGWQPWSQIRGIDVLPRTPITVVRTARFVTDLNGRVYTTAGAGSQNWDWVNGLTVAPGSPVTAIFEGGSSITLFVVAADGEIMFTRATNFPG
jgi:hypothetical protein